MQERFGRETWSIETPSEWEAWLEKDCATLAAFDEIGVLRISAAFKEGEVTDEELRGFAGELLKLGAEEFSVRLGEFVGFEFRFADDQSCWRQWFLRNQEQMLYVTYNCPPELRGAEDDVVDKAMNTLTAEGAKS